MANKIKGITIEIGGDTTKLDKALSGTNKQIKSTQSELKAVEKALKLDPGNTELIAQKQRLLADAVSATSEKLNTLKQAAATADEALARGKGYEAQFTPLKAEGDKTKQSLAELESKNEEMEAALSAGKITTEAYDNYQQAVAATKDRLTELVQQQKDVEAELEGAKIDQGQYDALQREIVETTSNLKDMERQSRDANSELTALGNKAGEVADKTKGLSIAAGAVAGGLFGMAVNAGKAADDLNTMAKQSGFSTDTIQQWQYASDLIDVSIDDIIGAARKMEKNMSSTSESVVNAWNQLGISVTDGRGHFRDAEEVCDETISKLSNIRSETDRDVLAMTLFGKSANDLAGIIDDGGQALRDLGQEAKDMGLILSQDSLDAANQFNDVLDRTKSILTGDLLKAGAQLAEAITPVLESVVGAITKVVGAFAKMPPGMQKVIFYASLLLMGISPIAGTVKNVSGAISGVGKVVEMFTSGAGNSLYLTFVKWAGIIAAVAIAISTLIALIAVLTGKSGQVNSTLSHLGNTMSSGSNVSSGGRMAAQALDIAAADSTAVPHLASGGFARRNNPFLAVVGDNPTQDEIIAPEAAIKQWTVQGIQESGLLSMARSSGGGNATMTLDGRVFARLLYPYLQSEAIRRGVTIKT